MIATLGPISHKPRISAKKIPPQFIYEIMDGKPIYYKGTVEAIANNKKVEEIIGSSGLQSTIIEYLMKLFFKYDIQDKFRFLSSELGLHLDKQNNLAGDICIFEKEKLPIALAYKHYVNIPPKIQIEIDIQAESSLFDTTDSYIYKKTDKLLNFGVEKVIWIKTESKKVLVATAGENWQTMDWAKDIEIMEGLSFNIHDI
jgi:Uma2 family endonuclease